MPLPLEIIGLNRPEVTIIWEDEHHSVFAARDLRLRCRCALCIEEMTGQPLIDPKAIPADVVATDIGLIGQYALAIRWSDTHSTGLYNFVDLREACPCDLCGARRNRSGATVGKPR